MAGPTMPAAFCGAVQNGMTQFIFPESFNAPASCTNVFNQVVTFSANDAVRLDIFKNGNFIQTINGNSWNGNLPLDYTDARQRPHFIIFMYNKDNKLGGSFEFGIRCNFDASAVAPVIGEIDGLTIINNGASNIVVNFTVNGIVPSSGQFQATISKPNNPSQGSWSATSNGGPLVDGVYFDSTENGSVQLLITLMDASGRSATPVTATATVNIH